MVECTKIEWKVNEGDCANETLTCKKLVDSTIVDNSCVSDLTKAKQLHAQLKAYAEETV